MLAAVVRVTRQLFPTGKPKKASRGETRRAGTMRWKLDALDAFYRCALVMKLKRLQH